MSQLKITSLVALAAVIIGAAVYQQTSQPEKISPEVVAKFSAWSQGQKRLYGTPSEMKQRLLNFKSTLDRIEEINTSNKGYTAGLNQFSDLTTEEFAAKYLMKINPILKAKKSHRNDARDFSEKVESQVKPMTIHGTYELQQAPASLDIRTQVKGTIPPVKNQGQCGSCYAFAATTSIEFAQALNKNASKTFKGPLSPQELVDCSGGNNNGCDGGLPQDCFEYAQEYGIMLEKNYPYKGVVRSCKADSENENSKVSDVGYVEENSHSALQNAIFNFGGISVGVEAGKLQDYQSGVFGKDTKDCGEQPNHAVVVVGYGADYWIVQNSWGTSWGEAGYYKHYRDGKDGNGACGIQSHATYPIM